MANGRNAAASKANLVESVVARSSNIPHHRERASGRSFLLLQTPFEGLHLFESFSEIKTVALRAIERMFLFSDREGNPFRCAVSKRDHSADFRGAKLPKLAAVKR